MRRNGMRRRARGIAAVVGIGLLVAAAACSEAEAGAARVWFVEPQDGAVLSGPDVRVVLGASGVEITAADVQRAGTGHHHIFINTDLTPMGEEIPSGVRDILHYGQGQTDFVIPDVGPGEHRLIAVLADWQHVPLEPLAVDTVFITVLPPEEGS